MENSPLRFNKEKVYLTNQSIIEFLYATRDLLQIVEGWKLCMEEASCYQNNFYTCRKLIENIDKDYRNIHQKVVSFFKYHEIDNSFDRIKIK